MTETDKKISGIEAISDDELEAVAGGAVGTGDGTQILQARLDAQADGRKYGFADVNLSSAFCPCHIAYKWARSNKVIKNGVTMVNLRGYTDIKCYKCGKTNTGSIY